MAYKWTSCDNPKCSGGTIFSDQGIPTLCDCIIDYNLKLFHKWSEAKPEHFNKIEELTENPEIHIRISKGEHKPIRLKTFLNWIVENRDDLIESNSRFVFAGFPGRGKTVAALAASIGISSKIEWTQRDEDYKYYFYLSIKGLISSGILFDKEEKRRFLYKVKNSRMLIIDDLGEELELEPRIVNGERVQDRRQIEVLDLLKHIADVFEGIIFMTTNNSKIHNSYIMTEEEKNDPDCILKVDEERLHSRLFGDIDIRKNIMFASFLSNMDLRDKKENNCISAFLDELKGGVVI
jgi:hypothetical protein